MALKKSQLYSSLWQSCDELRGGMDASQYKDYVLTLLFMKYVSDKYAGQPGALIEVPEGGSFADMAALRGDKEIGDKINKIISRLAEANELEGVIDQADFNDESKLGSGKEMQDRLSKLVAIFDGLDFRSNRAEGDDLLGDAYEYLMRHFATESGKSKGQFYTPAEVSRIMARVIGIERAGEWDQPTVYDPTCGSGSLLIKAADEAATQTLSIYGQEKDVATWSLARMNMILHNHPTADLRRGNTLSAPDFKGDDGGLRTFDFAVANPPFSDKAWSNGLDPANDEFDRFELGVPPARNGDYAFLLHLVKSLKSTGKGAIILPHGVLFRGNREAAIRKSLVKRGLIAGIIGLPPNLFFGTGIPACIVAVDKERAHARRGIFMIDASKGFRKEGAKNRLRERDIHSMVDVFANRTEVPRYSRMVPLSEIASPANDYNLNIPRYIDASEPEDLHDLDAHLNGGIPIRDVDALDSYWRVFPGLRRTLFTENLRDGYLDLRVPADRIEETILRHAEVESFAAQVTTTFETWTTDHEPALRNIEVGDSPRDLIKALSEHLLARFRNLPLLDPYDIYQRLLDYWEEVMQDDVYLIASDGWVEASRPRPILATGKNARKEAPDLTVKRRKYKTDLVPPPLLVARHLPAEQAQIDVLQADQELAAREYGAFVEKHSGDEGLLTAALSNAGNLTKASVKARLGAIQGETNADDERDVLRRCLALADRESKTAKTLKAALHTLDETVLTRYGLLAEAEIKSLVVSDKWSSSLRADIASEVTRLSRLLASRVAELGRRHAQPLPELERHTEALGAKAASHLKTMGIFRLRARKAIGETKPADYKDAIHRLSAAHEIVNRFWQDAPDVQPDYIREYEGVQAWPWVSSTYQLLEQALKLLIAVSRGVPTPELRHEIGLKGNRAHHLDRLFGELESSDSRVIRDAYRAYSALYRLPVNNAVDFLALIGRGYTTWRYLLLEGGTDVPPNHIGASLEIAWAAISRMKYRVFRRPSEFPDVRRRLIAELEDALAEVCKDPNTRDPNTRVETGACWNGFREFLSVREHRIEIANRLENAANPRLGRQPSDDAWTPAQVRRLLPDVEALLNILKRSRDRKNFAPFFRDPCFLDRTSMSSLGPKIEAPSSESGGSA